MFDPRLVACAPILYLAFTAEARQGAGAPTDDPAVESDLPGYKGPLGEREYLTGDWGGARTRLAESGLTFELSWTQVAQGVISGGRRRDWDYGGNLGFLAEADLEALGLWRGGSIWMQLESRYGETVNDDSGAFTPVNTRGYFPLTDEINELVPIAITELAYTHSFGEVLDLSVGKMLTFEGDPVEFAGGGGRTQFLNSNFIYNAATSQTAPYSTLAAAADWYPSDAVTVSGAVFATADSSTESGFEDLDDGLTWWSQVETRYRLGRLPGGFNAGFQYAFDNEFIEIGGRLTLIPGGVALQTTGDSWAVFLGGWQYLVMLEEPPAGVDAADAHADVRGFGLFARLGFADPDTNPVRWSISGGVGGRGVVPGRERDTFGVGYYYTDLQSPGAFTLVGVPSWSQGLEAFYNVALTPAAGLTLDIQWIDEGLAGTDAATVVGVRLDLSF